MDVSLISGREEYFIIVEDHLLTLDIGTLLLLLLRCLVLGSRVGRSIMLLRLSLVLGCLSTTLFLTSTIIIVIIMTVYRYYLYNDI